MSVRRVGPTRKYPTIMKAYYEAYSGDIILIDEGVYSEQLSVHHNKYVHFIGNTRKPGNGKVIIRPYNEANGNCITFSDILVSTPIYIEGINFKLPLNSTLPPVVALRCPNVNLIFNRCIINASTKHTYVFDSNIDELASITLNYCKLIWKDDYVYGLSRAKHFEQAGKKVEYKINHCIFNNSIDNFAISDVERYEGNTYLSEDNFTYPSVYGENELSTSNTTYPIGVIDNYQNMFDIDITPSSLATCTQLVTGDILTFFTDFGLGNEKKIIYFRLNNYVYNSTADSVYLYASLDNIIWVKLYGLIHSSYHWFAYLDNTTFYRYYKLDIEAPFGSLTSQFFIQDYTLASANTEYAPLDYKLTSNEVGYGPYYGSYQKYTLNEYYLDGTVTDALQDNVQVDSITFDINNKGRDIELSSDNLTAELSTAFSSKYEVVKANLGKYTGKYYFEFSVVSSIHITHVVVGFGVGSASNDVACGGRGSISWGLDLASGRYLHNGVYASQRSSTIRNYDIIGVALDLNNGKAWFSINGVWQLDGNPSYGDNPIFVFNNYTLFPMTSLYTIGIYTAKSHMICDPAHLQFEIPDGFTYYGVNVKWKVNYYNMITNEYLGYVYTNEDGTYHIDTSYSGPHLLICEDASTAPVYNDLVYSNIIPKRY